MTVTTAEEHALCRVSKVLADGHEGGIRYVLEVIESTRDGAGIVVLVDAGPIIRAAQREAFDLCEGLAKDMAEGWHNGTVSHACGRVAAAIAKAREVGT